MKHSEVMEASLGLYFAYLKTPVYLKNEKIDWPVFIKLFITVFLLSVILNSVPTILGHLLHLQALSHYFKGISQPKIWEAIFFIPISEETLFRFLLKPTRKNITYYAIILSFPLVINLLKGKFLHALIFVFLTLIPLILLLKKSYLKKVQKYFLKHFAPFFYLSCLVFGLGHVTNFQPFSLTVFLLAPLLTLPQLFLGTVLGFVRMKYGIVYSVLFHFLINFPMLVRT